MKRRKCRKDGKDAAAVSLRQHRHLGVYGVSIVDDRALLIRKARGPFTGLLDLPGGGLEFGEEPDAALRREYREETGLTVATLALRQVASHRLVYQAADGVTEDLQHLGLLYDVSLPREANGTLPRPWAEGDGQDSAGAVWVPLPGLNQDTLTPFARLALLSSVGSGFPASG